MTVKELKELLEDYDDSSEIRTWDERGNLEYVYSLSILCNGEIRINT